MHVCIHPAAGNFVNFVPANQNRTYEKTHVPAAGRPAPGNDRRDGRGTLCQQPRPAARKALRETSAGRHPRRRVAPRPVAASGRRADGAPRFGLPRGDGPAQRLAGRRRRRLGTRPLLDRRAAAAGLYPRRRTADRKDPPLGRVGARQPAARRLFRPGGRPSVRKPGHTARQRPRLVAQDGHAQGAATILLGDGRRARHRTDERLFPLPAARASEDPAGALDFLGRTARRRQSGHRLLALQHHGRRIPAGAGRPDPPADVRLDGHPRRRGGDPDALLAALREPRAGDQGAGGRQDM